MNWNDGQGACQGKRGVLLRTAGSSVAVAVCDGTLSLLQIGLETFSGFYSPERPRQNLDNRTSVELHFVLSSGSSAFR